MPKILVVYNTCGLGGRENVDWYCACLDSILNQDFNDYRVVVSSCANSTQVRSTIQKKFGDRVAINCIDMKLPVNITFNATVRECVRRWGEFEYYMYVDSGIHFGDDRNTILDMYNLALTDSYGMVSVQASNDNGFENWLGISGHIQHDNFVVPVGKAFNAHTIMYSNKLFTAFEGRLIPDIFAAFCTESVFSFLNVATEQKWVILKDRIHQHLKGAHGADGASAGFDHIGKYGEPWNNLLTGRDMREILNDPEAYACGFGYEECNSIFMHNENAYTDGLCNDPERLRKFLNENIFIQKQIFDYDALPNLFV